MTIIAEKYMDEEYDFFGEWTIFMKHAECETYEDAIEELKNMLDTIDEEEYTVVEKDSTYFKVEYYTSSETPFEKVYRIFDSTEEMQRFNDIYYPLDQSITSPISEIEDIVDDLEFTTNQDKIINNSVADMPYKRYAISKNSNTPEDILMKLTKDKVSSIRKSAQESILMNSKNKQNILEVIRDANELHLSSFLKYRKFTDDKEIMIEAAKTNLFTIDVASNNLKQDNEYLDVIINKMKKGLFDASFESLFYRFPELKNRYNELEQQSKDNKEMNGEEL
jgi:hypothetical protein